MTPTSPRTESCPFSPVNAGGAHPVEKRVPPSYTSSSLQSLTLPPVTQPGCAEWFEVLCDRVVKGFEWLLDQLIYFFSNPSFFFQSDRAKKVALFEGLGHLLDVLNTGSSDVERAIKALPLPPSSIESYKRLVPDELVAFVTNAIDLIGRNIPEADNLRVLAGRTSSRGEIVEAFHSIKNPVVKANVVRVAWNSRSTHSHAHFATRYPDTAGEALPSAVYRNAPHYLADMQTRLALVDHRSELEAMPPSFSYEHITALPLFRDGKKT